MRFVCFSIAVIIFASQLNADITTFSPSKDGSIYSENGDRSAGGQDRLYAGMTNGFNLRRALLEFDVLSNPALVGATINSVTLELTADIGVGGNQDFSLHRVNEDWGEAPTNGNPSGISPSNAGGSGFSSLANDVTWQDAFEDGATWSTPGGVFDSAASSTSSVPDVNKNVGPPVTVTWPTQTKFVADVQGWVDGGANHGWILIGNELDRRTAKRFYSREVVDAPGPRLTIDFTPVPEPNAAVFVLVAIGSVATYRRLFS